jgi:hypothetical protein
MLAERSVITLPEDWDGEHCLLCGGVITPPRNPNVTKRFCSSPHRSQWHALYRQRMLAEAQAALVVAQRALRALTGE